MILKFSINKYSWNHRKENPYFQWLAPREFVQSKISIEFWLTSHLRIGHILIFKTCFQKRMIQTQIFILGRKISELFIELISAGKHLHRSYNIDSISCHAKIPNFHRVQVQRGSLFLFLRQPVEFYQKFESENTCNYFICIWVIFLWDGSFSLFFWSCEEITKN